MGTSDELRFKANTNKREGRQSMEQEGQDLDEYVEQKRSFLLSGTKWSKGRKGRLSRVDHLSPSCSCGERSFLSEE